MTTVTEAMVAASFAAYLEELGPSEPVIVKYKRGRKVDAGRMLRERREVDALANRYYAPDNSRIGKASGGMSSNPSDVVAIMRRSQVMMNLFPDAIDMVWLRAAKGYATQSLAVQVMQAEPVEQLVRPVGSQYHSEWNVPTPLKTLNATITKENLTCKRNWTPRQGQRPQVLIAK